MYGNLKEPKFSNVCLFYEETFCFRSALPVALLVGAIERRKVKKRKHVNLLELKKSLRPGDSSTFVYSETSFVRIRQEGKSASEGY